MAVGTGLLLADDAPSANAELVKSKKKYLKLVKSKKIKYFNS